MQHDPASERPDPSAGPTLTELMALVLDTRAFLEAEQRGAVEGALPEQSPAPLVEGLARCLGELAGGRRPPGDVGDTHRRSA